jgi:hypothetical protein
MLGKNLDDFDFIGRSLVTDEPIYMPSKSELRIKRDQ